MTINEKVEIMLDAVDKEVTVKTFNVEDDVRKAIKRAFLQIDKISEEQAAFDFLNKRLLREGNTPMGKLIAELIGEMHDN